MKTILALAACALLTAGAAAAQTTTTPTATTPQGVAFGPNGLIIGGEGELAIPIGNFSNATGFGIGGYLTGEYKLQPNLSLTGRTGLQLHLSKSESSGGFEASSSIQLLPILAGAKYYVQGTERQGLFIVGEAGLNLAYQSVSVTGFGSNSEIDIWLDLGAGAGYQLGALSFKAMLQSVNIAHFSDALELTLGAGLQFKGL